MTTTDALGYLPGQGPIDPLTRYDVAALTVRQDIDDAIPADAIVPHRFNGLNVVTLEAIHYGVAKQIADALNMYELRPTDVRIQRWELPTEIHGKPAVLRVEFVDLTTRPASSAYWGKEETAS